MMDRELEKEVKINEKSFILKKFTAKAGLKLSRFIFEKGAPLVPVITKMFKESGADLSKKEDILAIAGDEMLVSTLTRFLGSITDEEVDWLFFMCMRQAYAILPGAQVQVMDARGNYCVEDIEYDFMLCVKLCLEVLKFGVGDFFSEFGLNQQPTESISLSKNA